MTIADEWNAESAFIELVGLERNAVIDRVGPDGNEFSVPFFVPNYEIEMCGHGTIAAVTVANWQNIIEPGKFIVKTGVGRVQTLCEDYSEQPRVMVKQPPPDFRSQSPSKESVAQALNIKKSGITDDIGPIQSVSTSRHKLMVPLKDTGLLRSLEPNYQKLWELCEQYNTTGFYLFAIATEEGIGIEARQFPNQAGYKEDPATGIAAAALSAHLTRYQVLNEQQRANHSFRIAQGKAMNRPSLIEAQTQLEEGEITTTSIAGRAEIQNVKTLNIN